MLPSEIVEYARKKTGATIDEIWDTDMYQYLNFSYLKLYQEIALQDKNYWLQRRVSDTASWVSEYALENVDQTPPVATGQIKIDNVLIKYNETQTYPTKARALDWDNLEYSQEYYAANQSTSAPFYIVQNNSIVIFPTPKSPIVWWLIVYAHDRPYDLTASMTEADVLIEREYHDVIALCMLPDIYEQRQLYDLVWVSSQRAKQKKDEMLSAMRKRVIRPIKWFNADFNVYL